MIVYHLTKVDRQGQFAALQTPLTTTGPCVVTGEFFGDWMLANRPDVAYRFEELSPLLDQQLTRRFGPERRSDPAAAITADTLVALLDVVEHIEHDVEALSAIAARMEPGAHVVITVPALQWAFSSWDSELGHFRRYSRASLRRAVTAAGLEVDHVAYLFPELLPLLPMRKLRRAPRAHADFPQLSPVVSRVGHAISTLTTKLRRVWPAGTSVVLTAHAPATRAATAAATGASTTERVGHG